MMKTSRRASRAKALDSAGAAGLPTGERAELQRQGAKAAARGDDAACNPMHEHSNLPAATGESTETWRERQEAWQQGHDAQSSAQDASGGGPDRKGAP